MRGAERLCSEDFIIAWICLEILGNARSDTHSRGIPRRTLRENSFPIKFGVGPSTLHGLADQGGGRARQLCFSHSIRSNSYGEREGSGIKGVSCLIDSQSMVTCRDWYREGEGVLSIQMNYDTLAALLCPFNILWTLLKSP